VCVQMCFPTADVFQTHMAPTAAAAAYPAAAIPAHNVGYYANSMRPR